MSERDPTPQVIEDRAAEVAVSPPISVGQGYMPYERFEVAIMRPGEETLRQRRDVLRASRVAAVLPIDLARGTVVLLRQFRLPAHLATGRGDMVEIVAGRVDAGESSSAAAARECREEIGITPDRLLELHSVLPTPGITDEFVTFFVGFVDSEAVPLRGGLADEHEDTRPFIVTIDAAIAALDGGQLFNALMINALQWLALNRDRLPQYHERAAPITG